jgi:hypothetical protein
MVSLGQPCSAVLPDAVADVSLRPDGALTGRVVDFDAVSDQEHVAAVEVELIADRQTVARASTDRYGRFVFENVRPGPYQIVVRCGGSSSWWFCRAWPASSAPPHAQQEVVVPIGGPIVRGQHPIVLPVLSLPQAATVTGLVAGAVAAPMIYHNSLVDNRVPTSP